MERMASKAGKALKLPLLLAGVGVAFAIPSAGLAALALSEGGEAIAADYGIFTPASVDPQLARRVAARMSDQNVRFTPAGSAAKRDRTVTVAVRVDKDVAQAISVRQAIDAKPGNGKGIAAIAPTRYNLGLARGYQSFARPVALPESVRKLDMPDLSKFEPAGPTAPKKPSRFQTRIAVEDKEQAGTSAGTLEGLGKSTFDLGGSYRVMRNLDVTAGVRLSQERDRLAPLTDAQADNQAVYVGTQFRF